MAHFAWRFHPGYSGDEDLSAWIDEKADVLDASGVITRNDFDGHHFMSIKGMFGLLIDNARQQGEKVSLLEKELRMLDSPAR